MRRTATGSALVALTALALAAPPATAADAAGASVERYRISGSEAWANWATSSGGVETYTYLEVEGASYPNLHLEQARYAGTLSTYTSIEAQSGFAFTPPTGLMAGATLSATGVPARVCVSDESTGESVCAETSLDLRITWAGEGSKAHETYTYRYHDGSMTVVSRQTGTYRGAVASGTMGDALLGATRDAGLGIGTDGYVIVTHHAQ
jgi:hypothetical protein